MVLSVIVMSELKTVEYVDIERYMGTWYEIAKFPQRFEDGLVGITATYSLLPNGKVRVLNRGYVGDFNGKLKTARGKAWVVDKKTNAKLKVSFFWPFAGDYWVIELGKDYDYAVISEGSCRYLWILSRTPRMDEQVYQGIVQRLKQDGFDVSKIELNPQPF
ncbi:MAG: outer membrane lipoprotein Blc [Methanomassiliicoccales archaeon PtaB.Bin215]|nr:MAG: outer membrane lipoprotein Blc [Methanomassiliicoccales archaeon PtaB.Bin215]